MPLSTQNNPTSNLAPQLPPLPEGPSLDTVRGPIEASSGFGTSQIALAVVAGLLILAGMVWLFLRSRKTVEAPLDPEQTALAEIEAASAAQEDGRYATLCANSIRRLLETRYDLPATRRTSDETIGSLPITDERKREFQAFLATCDQIKFAARPLSSEQRSELSNTAQNLIRELRKESAET
jgi:hypothetical protein